MVHTLSHNTTPKDMIDALEKDGAVIIESMMDLETLNNLTIDCDHLLNQTEFCNGYFFGFSTKRVGAVVAKSQAARDIMTNSKILKVMDHFLLPHCSDYQLNLSQLISIAPGEKAQIIHADDPLFPFEHSTNMQVMLNVMWAIDDFTEENGATQVITGSHKWGRERHPNDEPIEKAVMKKGSCLIWLGSTRHGGGANMSLQNRRGIVMSYNLGWLKSVDNHYLSVPLEDMKNFSALEQKLMGYFVHKPNLNVVNGRDPVELLNEGIEGKNFQEYIPDEIIPALKEFYQTNNGSISEVKYKAIKEH